MPTGDRERSSSDAFFQATASLFSITIFHFVLSVWFCSTLFYSIDEMDLNQEKWKTDWVVNNPTIVSICSQRVYTNRINNCTRIY